MGKHTSAAWVQAQGGSSKAGYQVAYSLHGLSVRLALISTIVSCLFCRPTLTFPKHSFPLQYAHISNNMEGSLRLWSFESRNDALQTPLAANLITSHLTLVSAQRWPLLKITRRTDNTEGSPCEYDHEPVFPGSYLSIRRLSKDKDKGHGLHRLPTLEVNFNVRVRSGSNVGDDIWVRCTIWHKPDANLTRTTDTLHEFG